MAEKSDLKDARRQLRLRATAVQWILLLLVALASIGILWVASSLPEGTWASLLSAVGIGLLVSASFGIAQVAVTGRVTRDVMREAVVGEVSASLAELTAAFYPTNDFPTTNAPNNEFNRLLMQDLARTNTYLFRGVSARYTAARLQESRNRPSVTVIIPDLTQEDSLDARVDYLLRHRLGPGTTKSELRSQVQRDIHVGLVGLYGALVYCGELTVYLVPQPSLDRFEIFQDAIWVTMFSAGTAGTRFPRTLRYARDSVTYSMQQEDCRQITGSSSSKRVPFPPGMTDSQFFSGFELATGVPMSAEYLGELQAEFNSFKTSFYRTAGLG